MRKIVSGAVLGLLLTTQSIEQAVAHYTTCNNQPGAYESFVKFVREKHGEKLVGFGTRKNKFVYELYSSKKSFSILMRTEGIVCLIAGGDTEWVQFPEGEPL